MVISDIDAFKARLEELIHRPTRAGAATGLAAIIGAHDLLVLMPDPETGALLPAPGFSKTLPGGATWRQLFTSCQPGAEFVTDVAFPSLERLTTAQVAVAPGGEVVMLLGGQPTAKASEVACACGYLLALMRSEARADAAVRLGDAARNATERAGALAGALETARMELNSKAIALKQALGHAEQLNEKLEALNGSLERQVAERTADRDRLWRTTQDLLVVVGPDGIFRAANPAWEALLGWRAEDIVGRFHLDFVHPDDHPSSAGALDHAVSDPLPAYENRLIHRDGTYRWISWVAAPEGELVYASGRNITDEKDAAVKLVAAQEALRQAQRMEAIGQLTGGVAHDFNNLLTVIIGGLDTIGRQLEDLPEHPSLARARRSRDMALNGAQRAATLTSRLLAFSRRQPLNPKGVDVNRHVAGLADLLQRTLGETIALETVAQPGIWSAYVDPSELENALINLAVNARDAMPEGGKLTIENGNVFLDENYLADFAEPVPPGQYVMVAVADTGSGMAAETLSRVFEPFFTTKDVGKGTGLGLSQVYGFARQSEGHVRIYSELGVGTTVKLYLPRLHTRGVELTPEPLEAPLTADGGSETILVVEDHDDLRSYSTSVLRDLGYNVLEAHNGRAALDLLQATSHVDLLFTDVVLPDGMHGRALADEAVHRRPGLKVLFTTGYTRNAIVHNGRLDAGVHLITKPFSFAGLATKVRAVLDGDR